MDSEKGSPQTANAILERIRAEDEARRIRYETDPEYRVKADRYRAVFQEEERQYKASCREADRRTRSIPKRLWSMLDGPKETVALAAVREWLATAETFLVLAGGVGTGKTVASAWALDQRGGRFTKAMDLVRAGTFHDEFWYDLRSASLLVIDDLGTEPKDEKGYALSNLWALIDHRYDWEKRTILTTNLTAPDFKAAYCQDSGLRMADRIREAGRFVAIPGDSMRERGHA